MLKIAIFISGRINCYENNLLHILNYLDNIYKDTCNDESCVNLFMSINGIRDEYNILMEKTLNKYIKSIHYEIYKIPENFKNNHQETLYQIIDGVKQPYTNLSCFYNDMVAF